MRPGSDDEFGEPSELEPDGRSFEPGSEADDLEQSPDGPDESPGKVAKVAGAATEFAASTAEGAAKYGGLQGAAYGAGKHLLKKGWQNPKTRTAIIAGVGLPVMLFVMSYTLVFTMMLTTVFGGSTQQGFENRAAPILVQAGMKTEDIDAVRSGAGSSGTYWQVVAAIFEAQKNATGEGKGPFKVTDTSYTVPDGDLVGASRWIGTAVRNSLAVTPGYSQDFDIVQGARLSDGGAKLTWESDAVHQEKVVTPWVAALSKLPLAGADENWAKSVLEAAIDLRLGRSSMNANCYGGSSVDMVSAQSGAQGGSTASSLSAEQRTNARIIVEVAKTSGFSKHGAEIAIATAMQESTLRNLDYGDRDSLGLFQQRPSQGWGTASEIRTPLLSAAAFFGVATHTHNTGLKDIKGWESMTLWQAADAVQRSGFPQAYQKWEGFAVQVVADTGVALPATSNPTVAGSPATGTGGGDVVQTSMGAGCSNFAGSCPEWDLPGEDRLQPDAILVRRCVKAAFPDITTIGGYRPGGGPDPNGHPAGKAVDIMMPWPWAEPRSSQLGDQIAKWVMQNQTQLGVKYIIWKQRYWQPGMGTAEAPQWKPMEDRGSPTENHMDHVHVSVLGSSGTGFGGATGGSIGVNSGGWAQPLKDGTYAYVRGYGNGHYGVDWGSVPASSTPPLYAAVSGTIASAVDCGMTCGWGKTVVIDAGNGIGVRYGHMSVIGVQQGQKVTAGQQIGLMGTTGQSTGIHLHLEVMIQGATTDPMAFLRSKGVNMK